MKKMFQYMARYKKASLLALLLMIVELAVELAQPVIMAVIIDRGITNGDLPTIIWWGGLLLGLSLTAFIAGVTSSFFAARVSQGTGYDMRKDLYRKIQVFSEEQMQLFSTSSLITRMTNDVTQLQSFIFTSLRIMLRAPLFIIGGIIMSFIVEPQLAVILLVTVPVLLTILFWMMTKGVGLFRLVQNKLDSLNSIIQENLLGIRLIKAFNRGKHENERFTSKNEALMKDNRKALRLMETTMPVVMLGMNLGIIAILWFGAIRIDTGSAQTGEIVAILNYAVRILGSFGVFAFLLMIFSRGKASASRVAEVLKTEGKEQPEVIHSLRKMNGDIAFEHVSFRYPAMEAVVLENINFSVRAGQLIGILGETGSGKSSLVQLIPRLYEPSTGTILIDGLDSEKWKREELRKQIGYVTQEAHLFSGTVKENLEWGSSKAKIEDVIQAAGDANIHDYIMSLPDQYETVIGQRGVNLSGGQKQRLSIARALVGSPRILILDDSTSALDARTEASVLAALRKRDCTIILIAQKVSSLVSADKILMMQGGRLAADGTHSTLLKENELYQRIFHSQQEEEVMSYVSKS